MARSLCIYFLSVFIAFQMAMWKNHSFAIPLEQRDPFDFEKKSETKVPVVVDLIPKTIDEDEKDAADFDSNELDETQIRLPIHHANASDFRKLEFRVGPFNDSTSTEIPLSTTTEPTPMAFPIRGTGILYGQRCNFYGAEFYLAQIAATPIEGNPNKADAFSQHICRLNQRLECVPSKVQDLNASATTPATGGGGGVGDFTQSFRRRGNCRCARALSDRAIHLRANRRNGDTFATGCYIPAGFAHSSLCGHAVALPYGIINNGTLVRRDVGNTETMCVPNAECRIGYTYTGLRCQCIRTAIWQRRDGTCELIEYE